MTIKILLTGASGFVGSAFLQANQTKYQVLPLAREPWDQNSFKDVDYVVHLAGRAHDGKASWQDFLNDNVELTKKLINQVKLKSKAKFIFVSTIKVYGEESTKPFLETDELKAKTDYGRSKIMAEELVIASGIPYIILRPPLILGKEAKGNLNLIKKFSYFFPLPNNISNQRSFIERDYLLAIFDLIFAGKISFDQIYNVANLKMSTRELFRFLGFKRFINYPKFLFNFIPHKIRQKLLGNLVMNTEKIQKFLS